MSGALAIEGERTSGQDIRTQNVTACAALANIVKSSLGPVGLDKMLVDSIGDVTITNDGATILKQLEVEHPAAKVLVELAELQDSEVGDGTTSVVILAAELLKRANDLVRAKVHPTSIMTGYRLAMKEAVKFIKSHLTVSTDKMERDFVIAAAKTSMSSKIIGAYADFFATMAVDAALAIKRDPAAAAAAAAGGAGSAAGGAATGADSGAGSAAGSSAGGAAAGSAAPAAGSAAARLSGLGGGDKEEGKGRVKYPISNINIIKIHGKSATESALVKGFALNATRAAKQMPKVVTGAKIACLDFPLQRHRMQLGVQVLVSDPAKLEEIRQREADITKEKIAKIVAAGANVLLTTKGIDDLCLKYLVEGGIIGVRRVGRGDMKKIAAATGATLLANLADMEGGESFDAGHLGAADEVAEERFGDGEIIVIKGTKTSKSVSIVLRGANEFLLDEMDRSLHDSLCVVQRVLESKSLVAGGGAVEAALAVYLDTFSTTLGTKEQLAIKEFAEALLVIPRTLAVNAAQDATDLTARLCALHHTAQSVDAASSAGAPAAGSAAAAASDKEKADLRFCGLDLVNGKVVNNLKAGVVEPAMSKVKSLRFATEAAITILRIDDFIKISPPPRHPGAPM